MGLVTAILALYKDKRLSTICSNKRCSLENHHTSKNKNTGKTKNGKTSRKYTCEGGSQVRHFMPILATLRAST